MAGTEVQTTWRDRPLSAWVPEPLSVFHFEPSAATARRCERAVAAISRSAERRLAPLEPLGRLLLRAEGIASSYIEGVRAPLEDVVLAELESQPSPASAGWVADNLAVVLDALESARGEPLTLDGILRWHRELMAHSPLPEEHHGVLRTAQGWIGGPTPDVAAFVPPPPEYVPALMDDLVAFANRSDVDPVVQAAVVHAQFETIHPFGDGNGRIGRVLIGTTIVRRCLVLVPPPVSISIARDPGGYLSGLRLFRDDGYDTWVSWVAEVMERAAVQSLSMLDAVEALRLGPWREALVGVRADASAHKLVALLPELPVVSAPAVAARLSISDQAARNAIEVLVGRGVLGPLDHRPGTPGRPASYYAANDLLELVRNWAG